MTNNDESIRLLERWKKGDEKAANEIFERYISRLIRLAHTRLSEKMRQRVDAEDVVQSAYRSFFAHAKEDRFKLQRSGDLWRLLAAITVNKVKGQVEHHTAAKRSIAREANLLGSSGSMLTPLELARDPTIAEGVAFADEVESFLRTLAPLDQKILELRLQERSTEEIAVEVNRATRTVRRKLKHIRNALSQKLALAE